MILVGAVPTVSPMCDHETTISALRQLGAESARLNGHIPFTECAWLETVGHMSDEMVCRMADLEAQDGPAVGANMHRSEAAFIAGYRSACEGRRCGLVGVS